MTSPRSTAALGALLLALAAAATAQTPPEERSASPRSPRCAAGLMASLEMARAKERAISPLLPAEIAHDLDGALSALAAFPWAQASLEDALRARLEARAFSARIERTRKTNMETRSFLRQARSQAQSAGDRARLDEIQQTETGLHRSEQSLGIYARLAAATDAFSRCVAPGVPSRPDARR